METSRLNPCSSLSKPARPKTIPALGRSHMEGTVALKHALVARGILKHAQIRGTLLPLEDGAEIEIHDAIKAAKLSKVA
jgi:hypothetical protein